MWVFLKFEVWMWILVCLTEDRFMVFLIFNDLFANLFHCRTLRVAQRFIRGSHYLFAVAFLPN